MGQPTPAQVQQADRLLMPPPPRPVQPPSREEATRAAIEHAMKDASNDNVSPDLNAIHRSIDRQYGPADRAADDRRSVSFESNC
jgi:hypothetical protein